MTKEWLVVVNPNAGIGKVRKDWYKISRILDRQGFDYHAVFTREPLHATELVEEHIGQGFRQIISVGGDGTMNEVVNGIFRQQHVPTTEITVGMISVGTGNDWIRTHNIPVDYEKAIEILKKQDTMLQDAGTVFFLNDNTGHERYFINMAGIGFDGLVAQKTNADKARGKGNPLLYIKHLIGSLYSYSSCGTKITVDGRKLKEKIFSIGIGIGQYNGGGMWQAPDARPDDGQFDMTMIKDLTKWSVLTGLRRLYNGTIKKHKRVKTLVGKSIKVVCDNPILLEADGESLGHSPFEFNIVPQSVRVITNLNGQIQTEPDTTRYPKNS